MRHQIQRVNLSERALCASIFGGLTAFHPRTATTGIDTKVGVLETQMASQQRDSTAVMRGCPTSGDCIACPA